jgi:hypothetical protein
MYSNQGQFPAYDQGFRGVSPFFLNKALALGLLPL